MKKLLMILLVTFVSLTGLFAAEKCQLLGKWKTETFQMNFDKKTITYTDLGTKKSIEWEYEYSTDSSTQGYIHVTKENKNKIEGTIDQRLYNHLYKNNDLIAWYVTESKLTLLTNAGTIVLEEDKSLSTIQKIGIGATAVVGTALVVVGGVAIDQHFFSEEELESITNAAVSDSKKLK